MDIERMMNTRKPLMKGLFFAGVSFMLIYALLHVTELSLAIGIRQKEVNVATFGARGDGRTDDAPALEKALKHCMDQNLTCYIPKTTKSYHISRTIRVQPEPGQSLRIRSNGAVIKPLRIPDNNSAYNLTSFKEHVFLSVAKTIPSIQDKAMFRHSKGTRVEVTGLHFDGANLPEKIAANTFDTDIFIGLQILAEDVKVDQCSFTNIYGYGLRVHNVKNSSITNSHFSNVGGRGATPHAQKQDFDGIGDAIYHALVKDEGNIRIANSTFQGKKQQGKRSRSAITFEYSTQPYDIQLSNLTISGYAKGIHIEEKAPTVVNINNIRLDDFNFGIANVLNDRSKIYFSNAKINVGRSDGNDNGDALAFLNYESKAEIYVDQSELHFNGRKGAYQSAVGLKRVKNSTINAHNTNLFFADGSTLFENCTFVAFGGEGKSFSSHGPGNTYRIKNSQFKNSSAVHAKGDQVKLEIR
jgi:hypothetical protein